MGVKTFAEDKGGGGPIIILDHFQTCSNKVSRVFKGYFKVVFKYFKGNSRKFKVLSNKFQSVSAQLFEQKEGLFGLNSFSMRNIEDKEEKTGKKITMLTMELVAPNLVASCQPDGFCSCSCS